jgi:hypothetical protein
MELICFESWVEEIGIESVYLTVDLILGMTRDYGPKTRGRKLRPTTKRVK